MIAILAVLSFTQILIYNNAWYNKGHWLSERPYLTVIACNNFSHNVAQIKFNESEETETSERNVSLNVNLLTDRINTLWIENRSTVLYLWWEGATSFFFFFSF